MLGDRFRPLYGVSLFLQNERSNRIHRNWFSSPLRGISISTISTTIEYREVTTFSSPLRGISISTDKEERVIVGEAFSSPLRGISISTTITILLHIIKNVFVPSTGYLYFYHMASAHNQ